LTEHLNSDTPVSPVKAGLDCCCPGCSNGKLFDGFLTFSKNCTFYGLNFEELDSGDGPAVFIIFILGFIVVGLALVVKVNYQPPLWLHATLWGPLIIGGSIGTLRPMKGIMIAMQHHYNAKEGELDKSR
jgi:uncharacterized protein (DUF983 family)